MLLGRQALQAYKSNKSNVASVSMLLQDKCFLLESISYIFLPIPELGYIFLTVSDIPHFWMKEVWSSGLELVIWV
jgi:hypothetical protein